MTRKQLLAQYLSNAARTPFAWGEHDCCLFVAGWIVQVRGVDVVGGFRGRYRTALGAGRLIHRSGGLVGLLDGCAAAAGLSRAGRAELGDVGVVDAEGMLGAAIRTQIGWAFLKPHGLGVSPHCAIAVWRI